ncbi:MAG: acyl-CoA dehydrogenase family protein, partial [Phenylobacterium sp.]
MNLDFSPEENAFRAEVRAFIKDNYPADLRAAQDAGGQLTKEQYLAWHKVLAKKGWVAPSWPKEFGGTDWTPTQKYIWSEESARAETLPPLPFGVAMLAPVIYTFGSQEQKEKFLPGIYNGEVWWCQGYSEPGAGSDLASLKTKAERITGDDGKEYYLVNGQKTWTTLGQYADWGFFLVRTDPDSKPQAGISFLLIDMKTPGITVKPIIMADGGHEVNEVFFDDVKVPVANLVGKENEGWTCAKFLLANERLGIAEVPSSKRGVSMLRQIARIEPQDGGTLADDPAFTAQIADIDLQVQALEMSELRVLSTMAQGGAPGPEVSTLKVRGSEIQQRIAELTMEAVGEYAQPYQPGMLFH